jgi:hypothetical protein
MTALRSFNKQNARAHVRALDEFWVAEFSRGRPNLQEAVSDSAQAPILAAGIAKRLENAWLEV